MRLFTVLTQVLFGLSLVAAPALGTALPLTEPHDAGNMDGGGGIASTALLGSGRGAGPGPGLDAFFADVLNIHSAIVSRCAQCGDQTSAMPEPAALLLYGTTLAGLGLILRRRLRRPRGGERT